MPILTGEVNCPCGEVHINPELRIIDEDALDGVTYRCSTTGEFRPLKEAV